MLLLDLRDVSIRVWKPHAQAVAKSVRRVVPTIECHWLDRQRPQLRELCVNESPHNFRWDSSQHGNDVGLQLIWLWIAFDHRSPSPYKLPGPAQHRLSENDA